MTKNILFASSPEIFLDYNKKGSGIDQTGSYKAQCPYIALPSKAFNKLSFSVLSTFTIRTIQYYYKLSHCHFSTHLYIDFLY